MARYSLVRPQTRMKLCAVLLIFGRCIVYMIVRHLTKLQLKEPILQDRTSLSSFAKHCVYSQSAKYSTAVVAQQLTLQQLPPH
jgi:hypothetical protein